MKIILSCNEDPVYRDFWPVVSSAYKAMGFDCHLAFLTNRSEDDGLVAKFREFGAVTLFRPLSDIPEFGQAKMIRFILASWQRQEVCYIDDIDLFPLSKSFITDKINKRPSGVLLCVGGDVYGFNGCYPVSQMTAEGYLWDNFINPKDLSCTDLLRSWKDHVFYDNRENINIPVVIDPSTGGFKDDHYFSDERLLKRLLVENPVPKLELKRGYDNFLDATIDRATFKNDVWTYDREKLKAGGYVNAHCARPYSGNEKHFEPLIEFIKENYQ